MTDSNDEATPKGMLISEAEFDIVSKALIAIAEEARKHDQTDAYAMIKRFVVRLQQHTFAGEGVQPELLERLGTSIEQAFSRGDFDGAQGAIQNLIAAVLRMDPDPALVIAKQLAPTFVHMTTASATQQQSQIAAVTLRLFIARLAEERTAFEKDGWHDPAATFNYVVDLAEFCAAEIEAGGDPFADADDPPQGS